MARRRKRPSVHHTQTLEMGGDDMRIMFVADTHSKPHNNIQRWGEREKPDYILHGGDIGDLAVLDELKAIAPLFAVRGNIDVAESDVPDSIDFQICSGADLLCNLLLIHIAVYGPKLRGEVARQAHQHGVDVVLCGHSHVPFIGRDKGLSIFNPGSIGPRRFSLPITYGMLELSRGRLSMHHVDCETGEVWSPPG